MTDKKKARIMMRRNGRLEESISEVFKLCIDKSWSKEMKEKHNLEKSPEQMFAEYVVKKAGIRND